MSEAAALVKDLTRPWRHGEHVDARGLVLNERLVLDGLEIRGVDLSGAVLAQGLSAQRTRFRGLAWLRGAELHGTCDLTGAHFRTDFRCDELIAQEVILDHAVLQGVLSLNRARIDALRLREALVLANLTLENAQVTGAVDMTGAEIMGGLWTAGSRLGELRNETAEISGRVRLPAPLQREC